MRSEEIIMMIVVLLIGIFGTLMITNILDIKEPSIPPGTPTSCEDLDGDIIINQICHTTEQTYTTSELKNNKDKERNVYSLLMAMIFIPFSIFAFSMIKPRRNEK